MRACGCVLVACPCLSVTICVADCVLHVVTTPVRAFFVLSFFFGFPVFFFFACRFVLCLVWVVRALYVCMCVCFFAGASRGTGQIAAEAGGRHLSARRQVCA